MPSTFRTILLVASAVLCEDRTAAASAILPGQILRRYDASGSPVINVHNDEGGDGALLVAVENVLNRGGSVLTAATAGDQIPYHACSAGERIAFLLESGYNYTTGTKLISAGNGNLKPASEATTTTVVDRIYAEVYEAIDLSDSDAVDSLAACTVV